jgi:hypothetical protein
MYPTPIDKFIISQTMKGNSKFFFILEILPHTKVEEKNGENNNNRKQLKSISKVVGNDGGVLDDSTRNFVDATGVEFTEAVRTYAKNKTKNHENTIRSKRT